MPIQVMVDESQGTGRAPLFVFAAVSAPAEQWAALVDLWIACLAAPPPLKSLHMREAVGLSGQFSNWPREARDSKLKGLIAVLNRFVLRLLPFGVLVDDFKKTLATVTQKPLNQPYFWAYEFLVWFSARDLYDVGHRERFEIFFDTNKIFGHHARSWYPLTQHIVGLSDPQAASIMPVDPMFRDDDEFVPLQVADLLAWLVRRHLSDEANPMDWMRSEFRTVQMSPLRTVLSEEAMRVLAIRMTNDVVPEELAILYRELYG